MARPFVARHHCQTPGSPGPADAPGAGGAAGFDRSAGCYALLRLRTYPPRPATLIATASIVIGSGTTTAPMAV